MLAKIVLIVTIWGCWLLSSVVGFVYPAYRSFLAIERGTMRQRRAGTTEREAGAAARTVDEVTQWLMYWVVFVTLLWVEVFSDILLYWLPFYHILKLGFIVWCMWPSADNGAATTYRVIIAPFFKKYRTEIDRGIDTLEVQAREIAQRFDPVTEALAAVTGGTASRAAGDAVDAR